LIGRMAGRSERPAITVAGLQAGIAVVFPLTIIAIRGSGIVFGLVPGEIPGPGPMFVVSFVVVGVFCVLSGVLFAVGSRLHAVVSGSRTA
ncbi:MAG: hypothetical protein KAT30_01635, partial [Candidatus Krumholzibacteria bacterium]|nr:hypothetical protein [Candidatus Krumholzibacteria bacterium]